MAIYKRGKTYWFNFWWRGQHIHRSTKQGNPRIARQMEAACRTALAKGEVGIIENKPAPTFSVAIKNFLKWSEQQHKTHPRTHHRYVISSRALLRHFRDGDMLSGKAEWREPPHVRRFELTGVGHTMDGRPGTPDCRDVRDTPLGLQCLDFIRSCQARRRPLSSGRLGLAVVRCLNALAASARDSGAWVSLRTEARAPNDRRRTDAPGLQTSDLGTRT